MLFIAALILAINFAAVPDKGTLVLGLAVIAAAAVLAFVLRQRRARNPLYDLHVAARRIFWVAAVAGIIVFGSLMGAMFIGQQFLQNVLGYDTLEAGAAILPAAVMMVLIAPRSAKLVGTTRVALHAAHRLRVLPARLRRRCCCCGRRARTTGRSASGTRSSGSASGSRARRPRTRSPARSRCGGPAWRRAPPTSSATSAGRSCSRSSARC